jgi:hypothetical protein
MISSSRDSADERRRKEEEYTKIHTENRERQITRLQQTARGKEYLKQIDSQAEKMAQEATGRKFSPPVYGPATPQPAQLAALAKAAEAQQQKEQKVRISAEPLTVTVKHFGPSGEVLETIVNRVSFLEEKLNNLVGTPKPASANPTSTQ